MTRGGPRCIELALLILYRLRKAQPKFQFSHVLVFQWFLPTLEGREVQYLLSRIFAMDLDFLALLLFS